jgi:pilus assembly protein CpaF
MSTIHANSAADALARLETLALLADSGLPLGALRTQLAASIDAVVHVARRRDGVRRVEAIAEVAELADDPDTGGRHRRVVPLFAFTDGALTPVARPARPARRPGVVPVDARWFAC